MPVKSLSKVVKHVKDKKKGRINQLHEHSRDARRIQRASHRGDKLAGKVAARAQANMPHLQRISFLQSCLPTPPQPLTPYDASAIQDLLSLFLSRFDEELASIRAERRPGRPPATRQVAITQQLDADRKEYLSGLWIPDLREEETLFTLRNWDGDWAGLNNMRFVRVMQGGEIKASSFPPTGQS